MKIGIFTDSFKPYTSGVVRSIEIFTKQFIEKGHKVYIFGPDYPFFKTKDKPREEGVYRFLSIRAPTFSEYNIPIPVSPQIRNTVRKIGLDIIHAHSPFLLGRMGYRVARRTNIPLVFTHHTLYEQYAHYIPFPHGASRRMILNMGRDFCNKCSMVVAPSRSINLYLRQIGVRTPIQVIPTGIELKEFEDTDNSWLHRNYGINEKEKVLLYVGRLGQEKNLPFLIRSFKQVLENVPYTRLIIVGSGPQKESLQALCSDFGIQDKVIFTGLLSRHDIVHCFASADIFTFPSVSETQGLVIGEAKAVGLPIVAIKAFGTSDMVSHNEDGFLTDASLSSYTNSILQLLRNEKLYKEMSLNAKTNAQYISASYCADLMLQSYIELIERKKYPGRLFVS